MTKLSSLLGHPDLKHDRVHEKHLSEVIARSKEAILAAAQSPMKVKVHVKAPISTH